MRGTSRDGKIHWFLWRVRGLIRVPSHRLGALAALLAACSSQSAGTPENGTGGQTAANGAAGAGAAMGSSGFGSGGFANGGLANGGLANGGAAKGGTGANAGVVNGGFANGGLASGGFASGGISGGGISGGGGPSAGGSAGAGAGATGTGGSNTTGGCALTTNSLHVTEVDVGAPVVNNEDEAALMPIAIAPIPSGGSRLAFMSNDGKVHVTELDANDQVTGTTAALTAMDFGDIYADANGGVLLLTRNAQGGGTLNCGQPSNLCGTPPSPAIPCYDMYMVRFDGTTETWATKLTDSSASLPPYSTGPTGANVTMIWWYAHHGRVVSDGTNFAGYFGAAISVSQGGCINIHQGDRMKVLSPSGSVLSGGFDWGCSHSGYERIVWDPSARKYVTVCKNDAPTSGMSGKVAYAPTMSVIYPVDLYYSNMGNVVLGSSGGYWLTVSNSRAGQPANADGLADVHLLHFTAGTSDKDVTLASDAGLNDRAPHLAQYGKGQMIAAWETSKAAGDLLPTDGGRKLYVQALDAATGATQGAPVLASVKGNRYQEFKAYPDGSVAYAAAGSGATKIQILRIYRCGG